MTSEEMIKQFLSKNKVTVCEDVETLSTGQSRKSNTRGSVYNAPGINSRLAKVFTCALCGKKDTVAKQTPAKPHKAEVAGIYRGDTWCETCRYTEKIKVKNEQYNKKYKAQQIHRYGSEDTYNKYLELKEITIEQIKELNIEELTKYVADVEESINIVMNKNLLNRLNTAVKKRSKLIQEINKNTDWDDWDTPLHMEH